MVSRNVFQMYGRLPVLSLAIGEIYIENIKQ